MPEPAGPKGTLYVVATPLGNLEDVTLRALRVLGEVSLVACEDTRHTRRLLEAHGIQTPTTSYFVHNERFKGEQILEALRSGRDIALVSDAGTPAISDPGERLVRDARAAGFAVVPVPGPSAAVAALSVCGLATDRFLFVGFLPAKAGARRKALEALASERPTLVFFESPVRVVQSLSDMIAAFGDRDAFLCREATKLHEEYVRAPLSSLRERLASRRPRQGRDRAGRGRGPRARAHERGPGGALPPPRGGRPHAARGRQGGCPPPGSARAGGVRHRPARGARDGVAASRTRSASAWLPLLPPPSHHPVASGARERRVPIGSAPGSSSARGSRGLQTRERRRPPEAPDAARFARAASNPPWSGR